MSMVEAIGLSETLVASYKKTRLYKTLKLHTDTHENLKCSCDQTTTVHRPEDDPRKECEECGNARGSNVRYYPT
jgi:hypothetical protein